MKRLGEGEEELRKRRGRGYEEASQGAALLRSQRLGRD